jgi:ADP-ribose pyrophosphatase YjhB (NUDIX family)
MADEPAIQLMANLVVVHPDGRVLLAQYGEASISDDHDDQRWWLPAGELEPYQHPDEAAKQALTDIGGLTIESMKLAKVQSFRGRRGWHVTFDYRIVASGSIAEGGVPAAWHRVDDLPKTMHGNWERETI